MSFSPSFVSSTSFTLSRHVLADQLVSRIIAQMRQEAERLRSAFALAGILLGGSYGRGDGGVLLLPGQGPQLYNDLDFFVFTNNASRRQRRALEQHFQEKAKQWNQEWGLDVDISPAREVSSLHRWTHTLMYQELKHGNVTVFADQIDVLAKMPPLTAAELPALENMRLMMNRGMGLLRARRLMSEKKELTPEESDFSWRNLQKCAQGCGDALLLANGKYDYQLEKRQLELPAVAKSLLGQKTGMVLQKLYDEAIEFKKYPSRGAERTKMAALLAPLPDLWRQVLTACLRCWAPHLTEQGMLAQLASAKMQAGKIWKNYLLNIKYGCATIFGPGSLMPPQYWVLLGIEQQLRRKPSTAAEFATLLAKWRRFN